MKYSKYPSYKNSGVEWLGEVPEGWEIWKLNHFTPIITCGVASTPNYVDDGVKFLSAQNIINNRLDLKKGCKYITKKKHAELTNIRTVKNNDLLMSRVGTIGNTCIVNVDFDFSIFVSLTHLRLANNICRNEFFIYLTESRYFRELNASETLVGGGVGNLNVNDLREYQLPLPPLQEQKAIATYLDHATQKIDTLIAKQSSLIALLKEKRQALISHTVTKGLNPDAKMKESGVEWLGEIPEGWGLPKISYIGTVTNGSTPDKSNKEYWTDGTIPWLASGCLNIDKVIEPTALISDNAYSSCSVELIPTGSLLLGMVGQGKTRGTSALLGIDACINQNLAAIIPSTIIKVELLHFLFQAMYISLREAGRGSNQAALNCDIIKSIRIPFPGQQEQEEIIEYINNKTQKIDTLVTKATQAITLLKEKRTALISAVATGKVDVRKINMENT